MSNRLDEAMPYYENAIEMGIPDTSAVFFYALALKQNSKYKEAKAELEEYLSMSEDTTMEYTKRARQEVENLDNLNKILSKNNFFEIKNLDSVNSDAAEYAPVVQKGMFSTFTSSRGSDKIYKATGTGFTSIFQAPIEGNQVQIDQVSKLGPAFTTEAINEGCLTFSPDGKTMVFAKGNSGKRKGARDVNLYISHLQKGSWTAPGLMTISDPNAWNSTPAFSRDGKTLYFASNRDGGYGGIDLYSARVDSRGRWGEVRNMGAKINTAGNEMFPYVTDDGKLYFLIRRASEHGST